METTMVGQEKTMTVREAAAVLDLHEQTVRGYVKEGLLKKRQTKRKARVRILAKSVFALLGDEAAAATPTDDATPSPPAPEPEKPAP
jgi:hypothetical protein